MAPLVAVLLKQICTIEWITLNNKYNHAQISKKVMPISIALFAIFFNTINASINAESIFKIHAPYPAHWITSPQFISGASLFILGLSLIHI